MYFRPVSCTNWQIFSHSSMEVDMGTVHMTCLPAFRASMDIQPWSGMGELM